MLDSSTPNFAEEGIVVDISGQIGNKDTTAQVAAIDPILKSLSFNRSTVGNILAPDYTILGL